MKVRVTLSEAKDLYAHEVLEQEAKETSQKTAVLAVATKVDGVTKKLDASIKDFMASHGADLKKLAA